jgi:YfiR/HmsC-like
MAGTFVFRLRSIIRRLLLLTTLLVGVRLEAQTAMTESQVKAMFVYNFLKFVEWPVDTSVGAKDPFVVIIIGEGATADATENYLESRTIGDRPLVVRRIRWDQSLAGVRAAFVLERDAKKLHRVLDAAAAAGVLTIGEGESFTSSGGVIGLLVEDRKVRFDVDTTAAQSAGLRVSSKLLALTRAVRSSTDRSGSRQ